MALPVSQNNLEVFLYIYILPSSSQRFAERIQQTIMAEIIRAARAAYDDPVPLTMHCKRRSERPHPRNKMPEIF